MKYIHKECGGEIQSPLRKTATCLSCGKSTDNWQLSYDDKYRIHFKTKKEIALSKQEEKTIQQAKKARKVLEKTASGKAYKETRAKMPRKKPVKKR
jgi:hypothetical protein